MRMNGKPVLVEPMSLALACVRPMTMGKLIKEFAELIERTERESETVTWDSLPVVTYQRLKDGSDVDLNQAAYDKGDCILHIRCQLSRTRL